MFFVWNTMCSIPRTRTLFILPNSALLGEVLLEIESLNRQETFGHKSRFVTLHITLPVSLQCKQPLCLYFLPSAWQLDQLPCPQFRQWIEVKSKSLNPSYRMSADFFLVGCWRAVIAPFIATGDVNLVLAKPLWWVRSSASCSTSQTVVLDMHLNDIYEGPNIWGSTCSAYCVCNSLYSISISKYSIWSRPVQ